MPFLDTSSLDSLRLSSRGGDVAIDSTTVIIGAQHIRLGSHVRIDAFCLISAGPGDVVIGDYVHIAAGSYLYGGAGIEMGDFSGLSARVSLFSRSDDYSGQYLTNPTVPEEFKRTVSGKISIGRHVIIGSGSIVMPKVVIGDGAAVGAQSYVNRNVPEFCVVAGKPMRRVGRRRTDLLEKEKQFLSLVGRRT